MRIEYTLPSLIPTPAPETTQTPEQFPGSFANAVRKSRTPARTNWRQLFHLDSNPTLPPPRKPVGLEMRDAASERGRWRRMLDQGARNFDGLTDKRGAERIGRMLNLLMEYQQHELRISARSMNETRG